jgi:hypothetical protein
MTTPIRYLALCLSLLAIAMLTTRPARAQTLPTHPQTTLTPSPAVIPHTPSTEKAIAAATAFMTAVITDTSADRLMDLCSLPFCYDDSIIVTTHTQLRNALTQLITAAAKERIRTHPRIDSAYVLDIRKEALFSMVPINIYFTVVNLKFSIGNKEASRLLILAVQLTDDARVVGIED